MKLASVTNRLIRVESERLRYDAAGALVTRVWEVPQPSYEFLKPPSGPPAAPPPSPAPAPEAGPAGSPPAPTVPPSTTDAPPAPTFAPPTPSMADPVPPAAPASAPAAPPEARALRADPVHEGAGRRGREAADPAARAGGRLPRRPLALIGVVVVLRRGARRRSRPCPRRPPPPSAPASPPPPPAAATPDAPAGHDGVPAGTRRRPSRDGSPRAYPGRRRETRSRRGPPARTTGGAGRSGRGARGARAPRADVAEPSRWRRCGPRARARSSRRRAACGRTCCRWRLASGGGRRAPRRGGGGGRRASGGRARVGGGSGREVEGRRSLPRITRSMPDAASSTTVAPLVGGGAVRLADYEVAGLLGDVVGLGAEEEVVEGDGAGGAPRSRRATGRCRWLAGGVLEGGEAAAAGAALRRAAEGRTQGHGAQPPRDGGGRDPRAHPRARRAHGGHLGRGGPRGGRVHARRSREGPVWCGSSPHASSKPPSRWRPASSGTSRWAGAPWTCSCSRSSGLTKSLRGREGIALFASGRYGGPPGHPAPWILTPSPRPRNRRADHFEVGPSRSGGLSRAPGRLRGPLSRQATPVRPARSEAARSRLWVSANQSITDFTFAIPRTQYCRSPRFLASAFTHSEVDARSL